MIDPTDYHKIHAWLKASRCDGATLTLNIDHIRPTTTLALEDTESKNPETLYNQLSYRDAEEGWLFFITEDQALIRLPEHPELERLIEIAYHCGYSYMLLIEGGPTAPPALGLYL